MLSPPAGPRALPVQADELHDYAWAMGWLDSTHSATFRTAPCARYVPGISRAAPSVAFVSYSYGCGRLPDPALRIVSEFTWRDWLTLAAVHDTMTLDLSGTAVDAMLHRAP